jgi:hypothetical protein
MGAMKTALFLLSIVHLTNGIPEGITTVLLHDCDGSAAFLPDHPELRWYIDTSLFDAALTSFQLQVQMTLVSACNNKITMDEALKLIPGWHTLFRISDVAQDSADVSAIAKKCELAKGYDLGDVILSEFGEIQQEIAIKSMPSSCNFDTWSKNGECAFEFPLNSAMGVEVNLKKCTGFLPAFSLECKGEGCKKLISPCNTDQDCGSNANCEILGELAKDAEPKLSWGCGDQPKSDFKGGCWDCPPGHSYIFGNCVACQDGDDVSTQQALDDWVTAFKNQYGEKEFEDRSSGMSPVQFCGEISDVSECSEGEEIEFHDNPCMCGNTLCGGLRKWSYDTDDDEEPSETCVNGKCLGSADWYKGVKDLFVGMGAAEDSDYEEKGGCDAWDTSSEVIKTLKKLTGHKTPWSALPTTMGLCIPLTDDLDQNSAKAATPKKEIKYAYPVKKSPTEYNIFQSRCDGSAQIGASESPLHIRASDPLYHLGNRFFEIVHSVAGCRAKSVSSAEWRELFTFTSFPAISKYLANGYKGSAWVDKHSNPVDNIIGTPLMTSDEESEYDGALQKEMIKETTTITTITGWPKTCNLQTMMENQTCFVNVSPAKSKVAVSFGFEQCKGIGGFPQFFIKCSGDACAKLVNPIQLSKAGSGCSEDSDCPTDYTCEDLGGIGSTLGSEVAMKGAECDPLAESPCGASNSCEITDECESEWTEGNMVEKCKYKCPSSSPVPDLTVVNMLLHLEGKPLLTTGKSGICLVDVEGLMSDTQSKEEDIDIEKLLEDIITVNTETEMTNEVKENANYEYVSEKTDVTLKFGTYIPKPADKGPIPIIVELKTKLTVSDKVDVDAEEKMVEEYCNTVAKQVTDQRASMKCEIIADRIVAADLPIAKTLTEDQKTQLKAEFCKAVKETLEDGTEVECAIEKKSNGAYSTSAVIKKSRTFTPGTLAGILSSMKSKEVEAITGETVEVTVESDIEQGSELEMRAEVETTDTEAAKEVSSVDQTELVKDVASSDAVKEANGGKEVATDDIKLESTAVDVAGDDSLDVEGLIDFSAASDIIVGWFAFALPLILSF